MNTTTFTEAGTNLCQRAMNFAKRHPAFTIAALSSVVAGCFLPYRIGIPFALTAMATGQQTDETSASIRALNTNLQAMKIEPYSFWGALPDYRASVATAVMFGALAFGISYGDHTLLSVDTDRTITERAQNLNNTKGIQPNQSYHIPVNGTTYMVRVTSYETKTEYPVDATKLPSTSHLIHLSATFETTPFFSDDGVVSVTRSLSTPVRSSHPHSSKTLPEPVP